MNKFRSTIDAYNKMIKALNDEYRCKVWDYDNPECYLAELEYDVIGDKVFFKCEEDRQ